MATDEWIILVPKGSVSCSVAVPKPSEVNLLAWVDEPKYPEPSDELPYTVVTVRKGKDGRFPPLECNGRVVVVREAQ